MDVKVAWLSWNPDTQSTHVNMKTNDVNYCHTFVQREKYASMTDPLKASDSFHNSCGEFDGALMHGQN